MAKYQCWTLKRNYRNQDNRREAHYVNRYRTRRRYL